MRTQTLCCVVLTVTFLTTSVWAQSGSPATGAQAEASKNATSQKKGANITSQGGSIRPATVGQSAASTHDQATHMSTGRRVWKPVTIKKETDKASPTAVSIKPADQASPNLNVTKPADQASPKLNVTKAADQASPKLSVTKTTDKASPGLLKQGSATALTASPTPTPAIKKGTTSKR